MNITILLKIFIYSNSFICFIFQDKEDFQTSLNDTENWLYEDGEDEKKQVYLDKYDELKVI